MNNSSLQVRKRNGKYGKKTYFFHFLFALILVISTLGWYDTIFPLKTSPSGIQGVNKAIQMIEVVRESNTPQAIEAMKMNVVRKLKDGESAGLKNTDNKMLITVDPIRSERAKCTRIGGRMGEDCVSVGVMQFKISTVKLYEKKLYGKTVTSKEAMLIALDDMQAMKLAKDIIFEVKGAVWQWGFASSHHDWFNKEISDIRRLST